MTSTNSSTSDSQPAETEMQGLSLGADDQDNGGANDTTGANVLRSPSLSPPILLQLRCSSQNSDENAHWYLRAAQQLKPTASPLPQAPVPVPFESTRICRHLKWEKACTICSPREEPTNSSLTHLPEVPANHPSVEEENICSHLFPAESCEVCSAGRSGADSVDLEHPARPQESASPLARPSCPPPLSIPLTPGPIPEDLLTSAPTRPPTMVLPPPHELSLPELSAPLEIPSSTTSSSNPSTSQSSESGSWSNALDAASVAEVTVPFDAFMRLISAPLRGRSQERSSPPPLSPSSTTSSHTHSHHSHKSSKSLSSLTFSREREMVATKANPPAGSVVVQQFSSGEAPNCTIIVNPQPIAQASPYRHRRYSRSRSRSRSPPPPPVVIMPSRSNDPHHHHECYSHHHHPPQVVYIGQGSRSSSRTRSSRARSHSPSIYSVRSREPTPIMVPESPRLNPRSPYAHISPVPTSPLYSEHEPIIYETQTPVRVPSPTYILRPPEPSISTHSSYSPPSPYWPHHERFYFEDGTIIFRVGVTLYKIHRHFFTEQSVFFRDLFSSLNVSEHYSHEPIILSEVKTEDFDRLLSVFYPISFAEPSLKTVEEWASVLMLATKWVFTDIRALAIRNLTSIASSVDKIVLGTKYDVHDWLAPAFKDLVTRWRPLDMEEGGKLGTERVVEIGQMRSELEAQVWGEEDVLKQIRDAFKL